MLKALFDLILAILTGVTTYAMAKVTPLAWAACPVLLSFVWTAVAFLWMALWKIIHFNPASE